LVDGTNAPDPTGIRGVLVQFRKREKRTPPADVENSGPSPLGSSTTKEA